jgi:hypothetical protein
VKVKIDSVVCDSDEQAIMLILSDAEKQLIANMTPDAHKFCVYPEGSTQEDIKHFMEEGEKPMAKKTSRKGGRKPC